MKVKVFKVEILVIDFDGLGAEEVKNTLENTRYPNRCIDPTVMDINEAEVEWSDDHPLNHRDLVKKVYKEIFNGD